MLNDFLMKYNAKQSNKRGQVENELFENKRVNKSQVVKATVPEFREVFKEPKAFPIAPKNTLFHNYDSGPKFEVKKASDPFEFIFGFKQEDPEFGKLSNYYQYNVKK